MDTIRVDVLIVALNKIEFDARLTNFINTLSSNKFSIATVTLDTTYSSNTIYSIGIELNEKLKTIEKALLFNQKALKFFHKIIPRFVLCSDVYSLPAGKYFKQKHNSQIIYDSREIYSALASLRSKKFKQFILKNFESYFVKFVDKIIVTGELDKEILGELFPKKSFVVIKNYPSSAIFQFQNKINIRKELNLPQSSILMVYQGVLLEGRGIELGIQALKYNEQLHFIILGSGGMETKFKDSAKLLGVDDRTHFLGSVPYRQLYDYTSDCDVGLCIIEPLSLSYQLALPNKLFEYCHSGLPVIATELPAIEDVFKKFSIGELVSTDISPDELAEKAVLLAERKSEFIPQLKMASQTFSWEQQEQTILGIFQ